MHKKIFYLSSVIILLIIVFLLTNIKPKSLKVAVIKNSYNAILSNDEELMIEIDVFINKKSSDINNINKINSVRVENDSDLVSFDLEKITFLYEAKIENENYYKYRYKIISSYNYDLYLSEAYLNISTNENNYLINIGSLSVISANSFIDNTLGINYLKGVTKTIDKKNYLVGCYIGLNSKEEINIKDITFSDCNLKVKEIIEIDDFDYKHNFSDYSLKINNENINSFTLQGEGKFLLILGYKECYQILDTGIKVQYESNFGAKTMFYPKFTFFVDHEAKELVEDLNFYEFKGN